MPRPLREIARSWLLAGPLGFSLCCASAGCSIRLIATRALADTIVKNGDAYASDDDPELVRAAVPFALKTMEQTLEAQPQHIGLLTALARNFTQFSYAFVQEDADEMADQDLVRAKQIELRARRLYLRAREYGLRGLDVVHPGFRKAFLDGTEADRAKFLGLCTKADVALLYWTGAPWTLAIAAGKDSMELVGQLPIVEQIMARALALDESWNDGALDEYYVAYDASRSAADGGGPARAKAHLERARALSRNMRLGPIVSYAEGVLVASQDRKEFVHSLQEVVATDVDRFPSERLANMVAQRRARWLLTRVSDLFAD